MLSPIGLVFTLTVAGAVCWLAFALGSGIGGVFSRRVAVLVEVMVYSVVAGWLLFADSGPGSVSPWIALTSMVFLVAGYARARRLAG